MSLSINYVIMHEHTHTNVYVTHTNTHIFIVFLFMSLSLAFCSLVPQAKVESRASILSSTLPYRFSQLLAPLCELAPHFQTPNTHTCTSTHTNTHRQTHSEREEKDADGTDRMCPERSHAISLFLSSLEQSQRRKPNKDMSVSLPPPPPLLPVECLMRL